MRRTLVSLALLSILFTTFHAGPLWAVTYAYIPSYANDKVIRVATDTEQFTSATISNDDSCGPYGVAVAPAGRLILVTCQKNGALVMLNNADFTAESPLVPSGQIFTSESAETLRGIAFEPQGAYVYIVNDKGDTVNGSVIRVSATDPEDESKLAEINVGRGPRGIAAIRVSGDGSDTFKAYVANYMDGSITVLNDDGTEITATTITGVGTNPVGVAASPDGQMIYVANYNGGLAGSLAVIDTGTDTVIQRINTGNGAWGVAVGSIGEYIYVTNNAGNTVTLIDAFTQTAIGSYAVGTQPLGIAAPKNGDFAYALNFAGDYPISVIDLSTGLVVVNDLARNGDHPIESPYALGAGIGGMPPSAPSNVTGTSTSYDTINLTWTDNSTDELGFKIERRKQGDTAYIEVARVGADVVEYQDRSGLVSNTTYEYRIRAYNEAADSGYAAMSEENAVTTEEGGFSWCFIGTLLFP